MVADYLLSSSDDDSEDDFLNGDRIDEELLLQPAMDKKTSDSDSDDEDLLCVLGSAYHTVRETRYLMPRYKLPKSDEFIHEYFLRLPPYSFRQVTRLKREVFDEVVDLIIGDPVFHNDSLHAQAPVHWQLACALDRLGNEGNGVSLARSRLIWGLGHDTVHCYYKRVVHALANLRDRFITWPGPAERAAISSVMEEKGFKGAVALVDGTSHQLHAKPSIDGNLYWDRKCRYSVNSQVVCDPAYRIRHLMTGMPGSSHDAGVFRDSPLAKNPTRYLDDGQYILGDSAYTLTKHLMRPYKGGERDNRQNRREPRLIARFNTFLAKARVINEHVIGIWKNRFQSLRNLRTELREEGDGEHLVRHAIACVVLHNVAVSSDPWSDDEDEEAREQPPDLPDRNHDCTPSSAAERRRQLRIGQARRVQLRAECLEFFD